MQAVILAGGKGTRMGDLTVPKGMLPIGRKPLLAHQVELLRDSGVTNILMLTGHLGEAIEKHFLDGDDWGVAIRYLREEKPLGTGSALLGARSRLEAEFLLLYGDIFLRMSLCHLIAMFHARQPLATLVVHHSSHPQDSDLVETSGDKIVLFHGKPHNLPPECYRANYGIYGVAGVSVMKRELLDFIWGAKLESAFPAALESGKVLRVYETSEYIVDIGTPERLLAEQEKHDRSKNTLPD
jgi:NDP-sugar pyrophosphorylase family protein